MLKVTKTTQVSGQSVITKDGADLIAVFMNATVDDGGTMNIAKSIQDSDLYNANKVQCRNDMNEFEDLVLSLGGANEK